MVATHCGYRPVEINASDDRRARPQALAGPLRALVATDGVVIKLRCLTPLHLPRSACRSGATLQSRILDAVEMQSVMGQRRPNCVIIDEIDGAAGGAEGRSGIAALLRIANATPAKASSVPARDALGRRSAAAAALRRQDEADAVGNELDSSEGEEEDAGGEGVGGSTRTSRRGAATLGKAAAAGSGGKAWRQQLRPLMRPIICICNDLYAPALRPLREVARVFQIRKPSVGAGRQQPLRRR